MRYTDRNVAVLGAGLSGTAAALLLQDEGARVTVLDSADERTRLKTTVDNLRGRGINVICGPDAERDSSHYEMVVLSPGIDPTSP
ncbi:MAG TPA: NAD(P)-binding protein, partial [Chthoniobacterales bacterium]|nr:NAD(P)-binding protein [Chthoniobacterales bacterium]